MRETTVFLVGNAQAPKTNSWESMTNNKNEAERLLSEAPKGWVMKAVRVKGGKR